MGSGQATSGSKGWEASLPSHIGRYHVVGRLAFGGMAEILLARLTGPSGFERAVVIKRILPNISSNDRFVDMFLDEARIAAGIHHPNVVHVEELGSDGEDLYLVMEYLQGEPVHSVLRRLLSRGRCMPYELAAFVAAQALAGLHAAHEKGVIHRDVSPHNIFLGYDGSVKVLDFGIAKAKDRISSTEAGQLKGKFAYMSPEQALGEELSPQADIFAMGIVLYEMATLHRLFHRGSQVATLQAVLQGEIPPLAELRDNLPEAFGRSCHKALELDPRERHVSALDFRKELLALVNASPNDLLPEERLAGLLKELFPDRLEQKREMLRQAEDGQNTDIPIVHDALREPSLPTVAMEPASAKKRETRKRPKTLWLAGAGALGVAAIVAVALAAQWALSTPPERPERSSEPAATSPSQNEPAPTPPREEAKTVHLEVETVPPGATVWLEETKAGVTPTALEIPRQTSPRSLKLTLRGYRRAEQRFTPDVNQRISVTLTRQRARAAKRPPEQKTKGKTIRMFP